MMQATDVPHDSRAIAVFDSGLGGLTVVRELRRRLPNETIYYFGDTARVPYGFKSAQTVTRFTMEICRFLLRFDPKYIVAACNTASAVALNRVSSVIPAPMCGVVKPGAARAAEVAGSRVVAVLATEATIASDAYRAAIHEIDPVIPVMQKACPLFVPLVEEGRSPQSPLVKMAVLDYLSPVRQLGPGVVVLGCTHYPMIQESIAEFFGPGVVIVDSASATAERVVQDLTSSGRLSNEPQPGKLHCYVSDNPGRFQNVGSRFLGETISDVARVSPEQFYQEPEVLPRVSA